MAMMKAREIRAMRARWEAEARAAAAKGDEHLYHYRIPGIAALDLVLGYAEEPACKRIPFVQRPEKETN